MGAQRTQSSVIVSWLIELWRRRAQPSKDLVDLGDAGHGVHADQGSNVRGVEQAERPLELEDAALRPNNEILKRLLRTWIQLCSNNSLYSDGLCYVRALEEVEVGVMVDVVRTGGRIRPG